ncbi:MAG: InlB B-repeat-containing protein [Clostridia bacterium]|nr:InlB B-repeat-containing protein [Clostridia bacterium]
MKKLIAGIMVLSTLITICCPALAAKSDIPSRIVESVIDVPVGEPTDAIFVCNAQKNDDIRLVSDEKSSVKMNDNGFGGDVTRNDGVSSAKVRLSSDERKVETYYAYSGNELVGTYTVNYYTELTEYDFAQADYIQNCVDEIEKECMADGSDEFEAVYSFLTSCEDVESVSRTEGVISYTTEAGITSAYTQFSEDTKGVTAVTPEGISDITKDIETVSWTNPNVLLLRPFRNSLTEPSFHTDYYLDAISNITNLTRGELFLYDDSEANPYNLIETLDKVGFFFIDSHGVDIKVGGVMCSFMVMENLNNDGITSADWQSGRVIDINNNGLIAVSGEYIRAHYEAEGRRLENTFCYLGVCMGMKYDSLKVPLLEMGATCVVGYTETVSIYYDYLMLTSLSKRMTQYESTDLTYNIAKSVEFAKQQNGAVDPAGWGAVMVTMGNDNFSVQVPDTIPTKITLENDKINAVMNNITVIPMTVMSGSDLAYGYTQEWESSNPSVVKILGYRTVKGLKEGTAKVTCTLSGDGYNLSEEITVKVEYLKAERIALTFSSTSLSTGQQGSYTCTVYPRNSSDSEFELRSVNEAVAVAENSVITGIAPGKTTIYATTADGEITTSKDITVTNKQVLTDSKEMDSRFAYALVFEKEGYFAISGKFSGQFLGTTEVEITNGYIHSVPASRDLWHLEPCDEGFYIKNHSSGEYLSMDNDGDLTFTNNATTAFEIASKKIRVAGTDDGAYIVYLNGRGISLGKKTSSVSVARYRLMEFSNDEFFKTVTFETHDKKYTQCVEVGADAENVYPMPRDGYTFLGWDAPLLNIQEDITVNAMYREGETDLIVITFMHTDGTVIEVQELEENEKVNVPEVPDERNGGTFIGWSENLVRAKYNTTVYAMYEGGNGTTEPDGKPGDVTGDGIVNTGDAVAILKFAADMTELDEGELALADVVDDDVVNTGDAVAILKFSAGLIDEF